MYLKIAVGVAVILALATFVWRPVAIYQYQKSAVGIEATRVSSANKVAADALDHRINGLTNDRCSSVGYEAIQANKIKPIIAVDDMRPGLLSDLRLCVERGIMSPYVRDELSAAGILRFTATP